MEILLVRMNFGDGLDDEFLMYAINKHQIALAKEAVALARNRYDVRAIGETFDDVLEKELRKAGIRFKSQGYHVATVKMN